MATQLVTRVPDDLVEAIDSLVKAGVFTSRSDAVRVGLAALAVREGRRATGAAIVEGYRAIPQDDDDELRWPDAASAAMIAEEPW